MTLVIEENDHIQQYIVSLEQIAATAASEKACMMCLVELDANRSTSTGLL